MSITRDPLFPKHLGARREPIYRDETEAFAAHELVLRPEHNWDRVWAAMVESRKGVRYRYAVGGFVVWAHFSNSASFQAISPILPLITDDYGISYAKAGLLVGIVMMMQPIFGLPASMIAGRWPLKRALGFSWFLLAVPVLSFLSPGYLGLLGMRIAQGIGSAIMIPATGRLIMQWIPPRGTVFRQQPEPRWRILRVHGGPIHRCAPGWDHGLGASHRPIRRHWTGRRYVLAALRQDPG